MLTVHSLSALSLVLLLFPLAYFLITSPAFLLVRLDVPQVRSLMRSHVNGYLLWLRIAAALAVVATIAAGRPTLAILPAAIAILAFVARPRILERMDGIAAAHEEGDRDATRRLRWLHVGGMLGNAVVLAGVMGSVNAVLNAVS